MFDRETASRRMEEIGLPNSLVWYAPLRPAKFRLLDGSILSTDGIHSVETYQEIAEEEHIYARVNLTPQDSCVWTVVLGERHIIDRYGRHDHRLAVPMNDSKIDLEGNSLISLPKLKESCPLLFQSVNQDQLYYYIRPSSFALGRIDHTQLFGQKTKISTWKYSLGGIRRHEYFSHFHTEDESTWLLPFCRSLLVTNSQSYIWNHPELDYKLIHPSQSSFFSQFA